MKKNTVYFIVLSSVVLLASLVWVLRPAQTAEDFTMEPQGSSGESPVVVDQYEDNKTHATNHGEDCPCGADVKHVEAETAPTTPTVVRKAELLKEISRIVAAHDNLLDISKSEFLSLHEKSEEDDVLIQLGSVAVEGTLSTVQKDKVFQQYLVQLSDDQGELIVHFTKGSQIRAHLFFYDQADAFEITGGPDDSFFTLSAKTVSDLLCAKRGSTYPLQIGIEESTIDWSPPPSPSPDDGSVPLLNSKPGSEYVIYCDFDGEVVTDVRWNSGNTINAAPFAQATDASWVTAVFRRVAEDFVAFDVNVTTDVSVFQAADPTKRVQAVITTTKTASPSAGGVAYVNSFGEGTVCWVFNDSEYSCAETISHEVGHTLGLRHDGLLTNTGAPLEEYYRGHGSGETSWGPIMGAAFNFPGSPTPFSSINVTQWSKGEYDNASRQEDDLQIIVTNNNGLSYREDDHADDSVNAAFISIDPSGVSPLGAAVDQNGIIERNTDEDWFSFVSEGGQLNLSTGVLDVESAEGQGGSDTLGSNLAVSLTLFDSDLTVVAQSNPGASLGASLDLPIASGLYYVSVAGASRGTPSDAFSDYASLGEYKISGTLPLSPIAVLGNNPLYDRLVGDGDNTPSTADGTFVGYVKISSPVSTTFRIQNTSLDPLVLNSVTSDSALFSIGPYSPGVIPAQSYVDFTVTFNPSALGLASATINIDFTTDVASDYQFAVSGIGSRVNGDDSYEQNDSFFETFDLTGYANTALGNILGEALLRDRDWYKIELPNGFNTISATATFLHGLGNIDMSLYDESGRLLQTADGSGNSELIEYLDGDLSGGTFYLCVYGRAEGGEIFSTQSQYDLIWSYSLTAVIPPAGEDNYEENDTLADAYDLSAANGLALSALNGLGTQLDNDWYRASPTPGHNVLSVTVNYTEADGNIDLAVYDSRGYRVSDSTGTQGSETITLPINLPGEDFFVLIYGAETSASGNTYDLTWESSLVANTDDAYEENDIITAASNALSATDVPLSGGLGLGIQADDDWYAIRPDPSIPLVYVRALFTHSDGNIDLEAYNASGDIIGASVSGDDDEFVSIEVHGADLFYLRVFGDDAGNTYDLVYEEKLEDAYENNNTRSDAYDLTDFNGVLLSEILGSGVNRDLDYYFYDVPEDSGSLTVEMFFVHDEHDLDMELYDSAGQSIALSIGVSDSEEITVLPEDQGGTIPAGIYTIKVYGFTGPENTAYNLRFTVQEPPALPPALPEDNYENNDSLPTAYNGTANLAGLLSSVDGPGVQLDLDWFAIDVSPGPQVLTVQALFTHYAGGNIDLALYSPTGYRVAASESTDDNETIEYLADAAGGRYHVLVYGQNAGIEYDLGVGTSAPPSEDLYENNDSPGQAYDLSAHPGQWLNLVSGSGQQFDNDWYKVELAGGFDSMEVSLDYVHTDSEDLELVLYRNGYQVASSNSTSGTEVVTYSDPDASAATYSFLVTGPGIGTEYNLVWTANPATNTVEDSYEDNDTLFEAYDLSGIQLTPLSSHLGSGVYLDNDWFKINVPAGNLSVVVDSTFIDFDYIVYIYDSDGRLKDSFNGGVEFTYGVMEEGETVFLRVGSEFLGTSYDFSWDVIPIDSNGPGGLLASSANSDGDSFPDWAEYTLDLDPDVFSSNVIRQFDADGYAHVQFKQRKDAIAAGFSVVVKESATLAFSNREAIHLSTVESPDDPDVEIVTYRCSETLEAMPRCFFILEVVRPDLGIIPFRRMFDRGASRLFVHSPMIGTDMYSSGNSVRLSTVDRPL